MKILDTFNNKETINASKIPPMEIVNFFETVCHADVILRNSSLSILKKLNRVINFTLFDHYFSNEKETFTIFKYVVSFKTKLNLSQIKLCN